MFRPSIGEIVVIGLVVALIFGARRLPDLGKSLGAAIRNLQKGLKGEDAPSKNEEPPDAAP